VWTTAPGGHPQDLFGKVWYEATAAAWYGIDGRHGRLRGEVQPDAADLRTLKAVLRAALRGAAAAAVYVSEFMHPTVKGYVKPWSNHGRAAERRARLPRRSLAGAAWSGSCPPVPAAGVETMLILAALLGGRAARRRPQRFRRERSFCSSPSLVRRGSRCRSGLASNACSRATTAAGSCRRSPHLRPAQLARRASRWLRGGADHLHDREDSLATCPSTCARARSRSAPPLADGRAHRAADGEPGIFSAIMIGLGRAVARR